LSLWLYSSLSTYTVHQAFPADRQKNNKRKRILCCFVLSITLIIVNLKTFTMKQFNPRKHLLLSVLALSFFCLSAFAGGEHYQVYLNNKLVLVKHISEPISVMSLLDKTNSSDQVVIHYSHCGQRGKDRHVSLKNDRGETVKEWAFTDEKDGMSIPAREIAALQKKYGQLTLSYSSRELPKGRALASLNGTGKNLAYTFPDPIIDPLKRLAI
jgi:hypothetical protein